MNISSDERRLAIFNIFGDATPGQVNIIRLYPGATCGWHRHEKQTDYYYCVSGVVRVGIQPPMGPHRWEILDAHYPRIVTVPVEHWHGYFCIGEEAILLQYLDQKYDPQDEEKRGYLYATGNF